MNNEFTSDSNITSRESLKKYYDNLLKEAEEENRKREDELQRELMTEDPLNINYARWSTEEEFKKDLIEVSLSDCEVDQSGIPLFCSDSSAYVDASDSHSLIIGSSGSKKTRLFILPSIYSLAKAGESMVVTDPKAELYERTSGYLKEKGYKVYCINFRDESVNNSWNPLEAPLNFFKQGKIDLATGLLNDFAAISIPDDSRGGDPFWNDSSRATFMGMLLTLFMLAEESDEVNIRSLLRLRATLFQEKKSQDSLLNTVMKHAGPDSLVTSYLSGISIAPEKTSSSILSTLDSHLMKFVIRPALTDMLCHNDIKLNVVGHEKTAVFLVMPDEKQTYHGLISIFIQQCYEALIFEAQKCENKTLPVRVNFLLDEFSSLPKIKEFPAMIAAARSRNIRFNIVVQSEKQLRSRYDEEADTIKGNCNNWIYLYSREFPTLVEISSLCGTQKSGKPLITTSRLQRLDKDKGEVLIMHGRKYPFMSILKDVNEYDQEKKIKPYNETGDSVEVVKLFDIETYLKEMDEGYIHDRLNKTESTAMSKITKYTKKLCINDFFDTFIDESYDLYRASVEWYKRNAVQLFEGGCEVDKNLLCEIQESSENKFYTRNPICARVIPNIVEMIDDNIAIIGEDKNALEQIAKEVYKFVLNGGKAIPIYCDMNGFKVPKPLLEEKEAKYETLPLLITHRLFDLPLDIKDNELSNELGEAYSKVLEAFNREDISTPEYVIILNALDSAYNLVEGIYQTWKLGACKNVRIVVLTSNRDGILDKNCACFSDSENKEKRLYSRTVLYYDEEHETICARQEDSPAFRINIINS